MNKIADQKIGTFLKSLSSSSPTPGGGAVAALAGAMAASLVEMVANLSRERILETKRTKQIKTKLLKLADADCQAFDAVMKAYKSKSKPKIKRALLRAIAVPEKVAKLSAEIEKLATVAGRRGNKNAMSDAKSAFYLAGAAKASALENVKINQGFLKRLKA